MEFVQWEGQVDWYCKYNSLPGFFWNLEEKRVGGAEDSWLFY